jgi:hypothetical protein
MEGCWFGGGTNSWIEFAGCGLVMTGCNMTGGRAPSRSSNWTRTLRRAFFIAGNRFNGSGATASTVLDFRATTGHNNVWLGPNSYDSITNVRAGTIPDTLLSVTHQGHSSSEGKYL